MNKNLEILKQRDKQEKLKKDIVNIKTNVPRYIIFYTLLSAIGIYYFEDKVYPLFGTAINFIITVIVLLVVLSFLYAFINIQKIKAKEKELKKINSKLYDLMKLEVEKND